MTPLNQGYDDRNSTRGTSIKAARRRTRANRDINTVAPMQRERERGMVGEYYRTILRYRRAIGLSAVAGIVLALLLGLGSQPVYRARTSLNIQNLNGDFMNRRQVDPTSGADATSEENVQTQIKLLQSESVMETTVNRLKAEPHPAGIPKSDLLSRASRAVHLSRGGAGVPYNALVDEAAQQVKVKPLGVTHLVEVTCDSPSAEFAAKFCNTLIAEYQAADMATRGQETQKTSDWLTRQVAEMRAKVEDSQKRLEDATGGNGLVLSQDSTTVGEDRLRQLQAELVRAQADRMQKEAESRTAASAAPETVPSVMDSTSYKAYQTKLADLNAQVAAVVPPLTEEAPKVIHLRAEIRQVESGMAAATSASAGRMQNEYASARHREELLALSYRAQESSVSSDLEKMSRVSLLRKELESEQTLYQTLLQRSKEAGFASAMTASTAHVVDPAKIPRIPFSPQRGKSAGAGMMLGTIFGLGFALYKDRHTRLFREPGEVERVLHVPELGVIPSSGSGMGVRPDRVAAGGTVKLLQASEFTPTKLRGAIGGARWDDQFSIVAEAYRNATFSLLHSDVVQRTRVYVVSSPSQGEGKTTITSNIGVALSKAKLRVALIDGDLRRPSLHKVFAIDNDFGLRDILRDGSGLDGTLPFWKPTGFVNLSVIPSGTGNEDVVELLHSPRVGELLTRLAADFDVILIDTPPMLHMADARIFAEQAGGGAILVVRSGTTGHDQAAAARDLFDQDGVRIVGTILNDFNAGREGRNDYYASYYRYAQEIGSKKVASA